jgi:glycosyltransferase involved in cell wall biosynthesis
VRVGLLSPYDGGSHRSWSRGLRRHCRAEIEVLGLPARFWKWRMHGAALTLARRLEEQPSFDLLLATDMLDLTTFLALTRERTAFTPVALYAHENQLTYPLPEDPDRGPMRRQAGERDRHYGFINLASMLAADRVLFNSAWHRDSFLEAVDPFLRHFPDHRETGAVVAIAESSAVVPVGVEVEDLPDGIDSSAEPPLVLWNQRWEYDKNPAAFFAALERLAASGTSFRVALCGERFARRPRVFERGVEALGDRVVHVGWLPREEYVTLLGEAAVVLSTADHEFFGISIVEAICAGAWPVLPRRLAYPEILPARYHEGCLYDDDAGLDRLLRAALERGRERSSRAGLATQMRERFGWARVAPLYDSVFEEVARRPQ